MKLNSVTLSQKLIEIPSYSGVNEEVIQFLDNYLSNLGFKCDILEFEGSNSYKVNNIHAIFNPNKSQKIIYFGGHTDVVNEGDKTSWTYPPFTPTIKDDKLFGRGAADMKCAVACFIIAVQDFLENNPNPDFGIGLLITNDEEADGVNGTKKVLEWMEQNNYKIPYCLVGEPTNPEKFGEMIKIGRRGSIGFKVTITGKQGHVAYPLNAINPITTLVDLLKIVKDHKFDEGNDFFDATNLEVTAIESQNLGSNVIPNQAWAQFNVRFNDNHNQHDIINLVEYACQKTVGLGAKYDLSYRCSGESFLSKPALLADLTSKAVQKICGTTPVLSTSGGTSDARFIKDYAEVVEIGLVNKTAHRIDEFSKISEIEQLTQTYHEILTNFNKN